MNIPTFLKKYLNHIKIYSISESQRKNLIQFPQKLKQVK